MRLTRHPLFCLAGLLTTLLLGTGAAAGDSAKPAADILKLGGEDFYRAVDAPAASGPAAKLSPADLLALAERVANESGTWPKDRDHWSTLSRLFGAISASPGPVDFKRLAAIYKAVPAGSFWRSVMLEPLSTLWIRNELAAITAENPHPIIPAVMDRPLPAKLKRAPRELQKAWSAYRAVTAPFRKAFPVESNKPWIAFQENEPAFYSVMDDFFQDRTGGAVEKVYRFEWSGGCGTGSEQLYEPRSRMMFMALLRERRLKEAAGALFAISSRMSGQFASDKRDGNLQGDFLKLCGLDWEALYAGAILDREIEPQFLMTDDDLLGTLAAYGSPRGARLVGLLARRAAPDRQAAYIRSLALFISPGANGDEKASAINGEEGRTSREQIPPELQKELLQVIFSLMRSDAPLDTLKAGLDVCSQLHRVEAKETLHRLLKNPSSKIARQSATILNEMGENVPPPPLAGPVKFRLFLNGTPLANTEVGWEIAFGKASTTTSTSRTDASGIATINRDYFEDPARKPTSVAFTMESHQATPTTPWFRAESPLPVKLDQVTQVKAATHQMVLNVVPNRPAPFYEGKQMTVTLRMERAPDSRSLFGFAPVSYKLPVGAPVTFAALQPGKYAIDIFAPGAARWHSTFTTTGTTAVEASLEHGSDVRAKIVLPPDNRARYVQRKLSRDGVAIDDYQYLDYEAGIYQGLPVGNYTLVIPPGTGEKGRPIPDSKEIVLAGSSYSGTERKFTIDDNSPPFIDLGELRLDPAPPPNPD